MLYVESEWNEAILFTVDPTSHVTPPKENGATNQEERAEAAAAALLGDETLVRTMTHRDNNGLSRYPREIRTTQKDEEVIEVEKLTTKITDSLCSGPTNGPRASMASLITLGCFFRSLIGHPNRKVTKRHQLDVRERPVLSDGDINDPYYHLIFDIDHLS